MCAVGVIQYSSSSAHDLHDPAHGLQQLDLLYLDEPAPGLTALPVAPGRPVVLVFCSGCVQPQPRRAQVLVSNDAKLAEQYALNRDGSAGPGYALIDRTGRLRYRTFDPDPAAHLQELQPLVDAL